jgi:hypothetical protein
MTYEHPPQISDNGKIPEIPGNSPSLDANGSQGTKASCSAQRDQGLDSMFDQIEIGEDEFDDLVIEEVDVDLAKSTCWLAVAHVHCLKNFSHDAHFQKMQRHGILPVRLICWQWAITDL